MLGQLHHYDCWKARIRKTEHGNTNIWGEPVTRRTGQLTNGKLENGKLENGIVEYWKMENWKMENWEMEWGNTENGKAGNRIRVPSGAAPFRTGNHSRPAAASRRGWAGTPIFASNDGKHKANKGFL